MTKTTDIRVFASFIFSVCIIGPALHANPLASLYASEWHLAEDIFITQPKEESSSWTNSFTKLATASAATFGSHLALTKVLSHRGYTAYDQEQRVVNSGKKITSIFAGGASYLALSHALTQRNELSAIQNFIAQWPTYKPFAPKEIRSTFDQLHQQSLQGQLNKTQLMQTVRLVKQAVHAHFPEKYNKNGNQSFFDFKKFEANAKIEAGSFLSGLAQLYRAVSGR